MAVAYPIGFGSIPSKNPHCSVSPAFKPYLKEISVCKADSRDGYEVVSQSGRGFGPMEFPEPPPSTCTYYCTVHTTRQGSA